MNQHNVNQKNRFLERLNLKQTAFIAAIAVSAGLSIFQPVQAFAQDQDQNVLEPASGSSTTSSIQEMGSPAPEARILSSQEWAKSVGTFRIGMIRDTSTNPDPKLIEQVEKQFSDTLEMPVRIALFSNFSTLIDAQATGRILYGVYSAQAYATLQVLCECVTPLVAPKFESGETGIVAVLAANKQRMPNLLDLSDRKIAWPEDKASTSILLANDSLLILGAPIAENAPFIVPIAGQDAILAALQADAVDGALLTLYVQQNTSDAVLLENMRAQIELLETQNEGDEITQTQSSPDLALLWTSGFLRFGPHAISNSVPDDVRTTLLAKMTSIRDAENPVLALLNEGFGGGYMVADGYDYQPAINVFSQLKER